MEQSNQNQPNSKSSDAGNNQTVKDPICGMDVNPRTAAAQREHQGKKYFFCSTHCAEKFSADPSRYA